MTFNASPVTSASCSGAACRHGCGVDGLRRAGAQHHLPRALLTRAWLRALQGRTAAPAQHPAQRLSPAGARQTRAALLGDFFSHVRTRAGDIPAAGLHAVTRAVGLTV